MKQQGVSVKGQLITKLDGKQQLMLRVVDPVSGRVDKYLVNVNPMQQPMSHKININGKPTEIGHVVASVTGYHKGSKDISQVSNKMAKFEAINVAHTFPAHQASVGGQPAAATFVTQPAATPASAPTASVGDEEIPF